MLENIVDLQPGDVVVQNGATSAVGQVRAGLYLHSVHPSVLKLHGSTKAYGPGPPVM